MKTAATLLMSAILALATATSARAQFTVYTNSTDFFNAITSSNFTESFNAYSPFSAYGTPLNFSSNGFSYQAVAAAGFFAVPGPAMSVGGSPTNSITLTNFSANIFALGGNFFATDFNGVYTNTSIGVTARLVDSSTFSTNYLPGSSSSFLGFLVTTNISSLVFSNLPPAAEFMTMDNVTVAVPEPSTYALLGLAAAGLAGYVIRRRRA